MLLYSHAIILMLISNCVCKQIEIMCPSHCKCDKYQGFRRATCNNRKLVVFQSNIPKETEILDLSYNQISELTEHIFQEEELLSLKLLNLSHNKVSQIHLRAFTKLDHVKSIDLSYNMLRYLTPLWMNDLKVIEEFYLAGNSFTKFEAPIFHSETLKRIDLSRSQISYMSKDAFSQLPNLEIIDLSENNMIQIKVDLIVSLTNLKTFLLAQNPISCNADSAAVTDYCVKKGIRYDDPCEKKTSKDKIGDKFERMVMAGPEDERNSWIYEEEEEELAGNGTKSNDSCGNETIRQSLLERIVNLSPLLSILIPFVYGVAVGILIAYNVRIRPKDEKKPENDTSAQVSIANRRSSKLLNQTPTKRNSLRRSNSLFSRRPPKNDDVLDSLVMTECTNSETTPMMPRKSCNY